MSSVVKPLELRSTTAQNKDICTLTDRSLEASDATCAPVKRATEAEREALRRWMFPRRIPPMQPLQSIGVAHPAEQFTISPSYVATSTLSRIKAFPRLQAEPSRTMWYSSSESSQRSGPVPMQAVPSNNESVVESDIFEGVDPSADDVADNLGRRNFDESRSDSGESSYEGDDELDDDDF